MSWKQLIGDYFGAGASQHLDLLGSCVLVLAVFGGPTDTFSSRTETTRRSRVPTLLPEPPPALPGGLATEKFTSSATGQKHHSTH